MGKEGLETRKAVDDKRKREEAEERRNQSLWEWARSKDDFESENWTQMLRLYLSSNSSKGIKLRRAHSSYSRQYNKVYGYTFATFIGAVILASSIGTLVKKPPKGPDQA